MFKQMRRFKENFFFSLSGLFFFLFFFLSEPLYEIFMADATGRPSMLHHKKISVFYQRNAW